MISPATVCKEKGRALMKSEFPDWFYPAVLALLILLLNLNTFRNGFIATDAAFLSEVPDVSRIALTGEAAKTGHSPMADLSLIANRALAGNNPDSFRAANVILHGAASLLLFALSATLLKSRIVGFVATLLFVVHPVHVESIQRIQDRGILVAAIPILAALHLYATREGSWRTSAGICALYGAALVSSPASLAFPLLYGLTVIFMRSRGGEAVTVAGKRLLMDSALYGQLVLTSLYIIGAPTVWVFPGKTPFVDNPAAYAPLGSRLLTAADVVGRSLMLLLFPFRLSAEYSYNAVPLIGEVHSSRLLASVAALTFLAIAAVFLSRRKPVYLFSMLFFVLAFFPFSNLFLPARSIFSEGFLYLPSAAFFWALARLFQDLDWIPESVRDDAVPLVRRFKAPAIVVVCLLMPWAGKSYLRNEDWKDDATLFRAAVRITPESAKARLQLGDSYFARADYLGAERQFYQAVQIYPDYVEAAIRLAATYQALDRYPKAQELLNGFAGRSGRFEAERLRELGRTAFGMGDYAGAERYYQQSLAVNEADPVTHKEVGLLYSQFLNQPEKGRTHLERSRLLENETRGLPPNQ
jgi:tetratricopeptide (TPR) repeat protein